MPPKKKMKKRKTKPKPTNTNINKQVVIVNQPVKRKYTRRKSTTHQPKSQFTTPESSFGQVFNLLRFIPQYQQPNYQSIQNAPQPIQMIKNQTEHIYDDDDDTFSSVSGSARDFDDSSTIFKDDYKPSHKPDLLTSVEEVGGGAEEVVGGGGGGERERIKIKPKRQVKRGSQRWENFDDVMLMEEQEKWLKSKAKNRKQVESNIRSIEAELKRRGID